jgi:hypothetical protein
VIALELCFVAAASIVLRGRKHTERRLERGGKLRDLEAEKRRRTRRQALMLCFGSVGLVLMLRLGELGMVRAALLPDYVKASLLARSERLARLASMDDDANLVWFEIDPSGFNRPADVERGLFDVFGSSLGELFFRSVAQSVLLSTFALVSWRILISLRPARSLSLAGIPIEASKACYHLLITGSPGSGKSTAIKDLLDQIRKRRQRAIVYDLGGEYIAAYFREGHDKLLNPFDKRSDRWTPWSELRTPTDATMIATSLFPPGGRDPFWADAAATLFASTVEALDRAGRRSNRGLHRALVRGDLGRLYELLSDTSAARFLDPKAGVMPGNVLATVGTKLGIFSLLPDPKESSTAVSIRDLVESNDDRWLFLSTPEARAPQMKPLLSLWCDLAAAQILSLPETNAPKLFFVLDEVASLQRLPALPALLERGRKHGASVVLGLQAIPQLRDAYGLDGAAALAAQPQTWLVLRSVEPDTARWLEGALGSAEVVEPARSMANVGTPREAHSVQEHSRTRPLVLASEIASLPDFAGFLKAPGSADVFRVRFEPKHRDPLSEPFIPIEP